MIDEYVGINSSKYIKNNIYFKNIFIVPSPHMENDVVILTEK